MPTTENFDITINSGYLATFGNTTLEMYKVFREFIDNALQSYVDHEDELKQINPNGRLTIQITWNKDEIIVKDNAWGMDHEAFARAMKLNERSPNAEKEGQLSVFGVGLKSAACYASRDYFISSAAYHSGKQFDTEMDIDAIEKNNPPTNPVRISDCSLLEHFTRITLHRLRPTCRFTASSSKKVKTTLGKIYANYIEDGRLEIVINNEKVERPEPKFHKEDYLDGWNGSRVYATIERSDPGFLFNDQEYCYSGWVGMLETGDTSGDTTGLFIYQAGRAIQLAYHPSQLFGKKNDYRYQRVTGEIDLKGTNWPITVNKDQVLLEGGLEEKFIESLRSDPKVLAVFDTAKRFRARASKPNLGKILKGAEENFAGVTPRGVKPVAEEGPEQPDLDKPEVSAPESVSDSPAVPSEMPTVQATQSAPTIFKVIRAFRGTNYILTIKLEDGVPEGDWLKIDHSPSSEDPNAYDLVINKNIPFFKKYFGNALSSGLLVSFAQCLAAAMLGSVKDGLSLEKSHTILQNFNDFVRQSANDHE